MGYNMKNLVLTALIMLALLAGIQNLFAFESTVGIRGGIGMPFNDYNDTGCENNPGIMLGASYEAWLKEYLSLGIYPYYTKFNGNFYYPPDYKGPEYGTDYNVWIAGADILAKYRPTKHVVIDFNSGCLRRIAPFVELGAGLAYYKTAEQNSGKDEYFPGAKGLAVIAPSVGAGISFQTKWPLSVDLGARFDFSWTDRIDTFDEEDLNDAYLMPYLGIGWTFGGKKEAATSDSSKRKPLKDKISMKEDFTLEGVQFEFDSAVLTSEARTILSDVVIQMKKYPAVRFDIQGHTDNVGTESYNDDLSLRRADSVKNYLVENGVAPERLDTHGFGFRVPVATNDTSEGRAENRRIEFVIIK
jgi:outer membrane protein OmpA-like peptidoglycan-associated protein